MLRNNKAMLFCSQIILTGALLTGAPCLAFGSEPDYSGEGQIHKPESLEAPDYTSDPDFVDDSTDNTYGYYTIMGETTVSLAQMTSQYEERGVEYPAATLKEGGASTIDEFCTIILEEVYVEKLYMNRQCWKPDGFNMEGIPVHHSLILQALERPEAELPGYLILMSVQESAHRCSI